jgi:hypothetical protein
LGFPGFHPAFIFEQFLWRTSRKAWKKISRKSCLPFGGASREKISSRRRKSRLESRSHHKNDA